MRMQMFNVQSKNRQEVSLVYFTNGTKRLMEKKLKRKPLSSTVSVKAVQIIKYTLILFNC